MVLSQSVEDNDNWLLVTDKPEKLLSLLTPLSTKKLTSIQETPTDNFSAFMSPSDKKDQLSQTSSRSSRITTHFDTQSSLQPLPLRLPHYNFWHHIQDAPLLSISETTENTLWSSMTIYQNKQSHTDKCHFFWEDPQEERLIQVTSFIFTADCSKERPKWTSQREEEVWQHFQSSKPKQVMSQPIFQLTSSQSLMVKFS